MQSDGNMVIYDPSNKALWASNSKSLLKQTNVLVMQDDGNLVLTRLGVRVWTSNTAGK